MQIIMLYTQVLDDKLWTQNLRHLLGGLKIEPMTEPNLKLGLFVKCFESESTDSAKYLQYLSPSLRFEPETRLKSFHETSPW